MASLGLMLPLLAAIQLSGVCGWNQHERVLLREVQAITLYADRYTNARRAAPIPQLKCIGGSAGCSAMIPHVVQCHNRGWDGIDVQWECKVDMDNSYRFGKVEVSCEGFDYPEDPYILRGSCGLEYTLELTEEGRKGSQSGYSSTGFGSGFFQGKSKSWNAEHSSDGSGVIVFLFLLGLAYGVYKLFLSGPSSQQQHPQPDNYGPEHQSNSQTSAPPPPGFKSDFTGASSGFSNFGGASSFGSHANQRPGFWTGLGTGGILGYLFGNRQSSTHYSPYTPNHNTWSGSSFHGSSARSSGVRTASGFGGTKRR
ncbi:store-operated calcium entry-associated regulatory factor isoform X2 [Bufo bufo]|uniref:store-operated calcium entry-associated regulatory factor isoform X2 n=1 Tax=Bufo bufo TaxID=8384 RepID=UPI001ABEDBD6|nr:store-operated calcium entry-associated regulatory factor isoform X2 [Bufo bufo]